MANNLTIYPQYSPRLIIVDSPDTEETMQNLVDDVRTWENIPANLSYAKIIDASGKEPLGGDVLVGITVKLNNAKLGFAPRNDSVYEGSITTSNASGTLLVDSGADFITDGVQPGATIINFTDKSAATVLSVSSATELVCFPLTDGFDNQFDISDVYKIWNTIQVEATGGNLTAVDGNGIDIPSIFPTAFTQVVRTSSSSATLQEQADIRFASYDGGVTIDFDNITGRAIDSDTYPAGTLRQPVRTLANLNSVISQTGIYVSYVLGDLALDNSFSWAGITFIGESVAKTTITVPANADVNNCEYENAFITGTLDGSSVIIGGEISGLDFIEGKIERCFIGPGDISLGTNTTAEIIECYSAIPGTDTPLIDMNGTGRLALRNYFGGIELTNYTGSEEHSIDMSSGQCILNSASIVSGTFVVRGEGKLIDENGDRILTGTWNGGVTVINQTSDMTRMLIEELHKIRGLEKGTTATWTPDQVIAGDVTIDVTGDGEDVTILNRQ